MLPVEGALSKLCCKNSILSEMLETISQKSKKTHQIKEKLISLRKIDRFPCWRLWRVCFAQCARIVHRLDGSHKVGGI